MTQNTLYYGDNLDILQRYIRDETVDLVYLDPPFNSKATYNILFGEQNGSRAAAQIKAFEDTWRWDQAAAQAYQEVVEEGGKVSQAMQAFRTLLGDNDMLAYLSMMAPRLVELRRVLKRTGSIYLHCDPTASHYLKLLMDAVFGTRQFRNEIVWHYRTFHGQLKTYFPKKHDILLYYTKTQQWTFNRLFDERYEDTIDYVRWNKYLVRGNVIVGANMPMQDTRFTRFYRAWVREHGREPAPDDVVYVVEGQSLDTVWDLKAVDPKDKSRLGYPTQKPEPLLERIIRASSNEGDLVLDPFCGCGTTIAAAQKLNRPWIGIDITHLAITLIKHRLRDAFGDEATYGVIGEPVSLPDAETLAASDHYQFQFWALGLVGARPVEEKKGSDRGIDGRLPFHDEAGLGKTKQVMLSVKGGRTSPRDVRDLLGVLEREKAQIGVLISMAEPTQAMRTEAAGAGFYDSPGWGTPHPRLQILTVGQLLSGERIDMPPIGQVSVTFKKAPRAKGATVQQLPLDE